MAKPVIGVLIYRSGRQFGESRYLRGLVKAGAKEGCEVFFFGDQDVYPKERWIRGFVPKEGAGWVPKRFAWPDVVIDRRRSNWNKEFRKFRRRPLFHYVNNRFTYKWKATRLFADAEDTARYIPDTMMYSPGNLKLMLEKYPILYIKPGNGTGGSSVVRISHRNDRYRVLGRPKQRKPTEAAFNDVAEVQKWMNRWVQAQSIRSGRFMIQQGLDLELVPGRAVDARLFIQKNGKGEWEVTGIAARVGGRKSPTTNLLYGDGYARSFIPFIRKRFGTAKAGRILADCEHMAMAIVRVIEKRFGRMLEFGLDVGVDTDGRVWLIEVNPKPCRDVFLKTGEKQIYQRTVRRPIQYAKYVAGHKQDAAANE